MSKNFSIAIILLVGIIFANTAFAQEPAQQEMPQQGIQSIAHEFFRAEVVQIIEQGEKDNAGMKEPYQIVQLKLLTGPEKDKEIEVRHGDFFAIQKSQFVEKGEIVIVGKGADNYYITEKYRLPGILWITAIFVAVAVFFGRKKAVTAIIGLVISIAIFMFFIIPQILAGENPLLVTFIGSLFILLATFFLAHGFNKRITIAFVSTVLTLGIGIITSVIFSSLTKLSGAATEDAYFLQTAGFAGVDMRGLLLSGMIIGVLGVLDDITTAQAAVSEELKKANPRFTFAELYKRSLSVGHEHIASLINTLFLAYAGASFFLLVTFTVARGGTPLWMTFNDEILAEEIVRTLVGSISLILAVPITTFLAAYYFGKQRI